MSGETRLEVGLGNEHFSANVSGVASGPGVDAPRMLAIENLDPLELVVTVIVGVDEGGEAKLVGAETLADVALARFECNTVCVDEGKEGDETFSGG